MKQSYDVPAVRIGPAGKPTLPLALGGSIFAGNDWPYEVEQELLSTMAAALDQGMTHFDTASGYGNGRSEELIGQFLAGRRDAVFVASKSSVDAMDAALMLAEVEHSLARLRTDVIDLYYIHWPRRGNDLRPLMEGLERARAQGKIRAVGVSNFSVEQMEQVAQAGTIDAHQFCYNLLWRFAEADVLPYCREHGIAVVTYSSIAQGILTGKFPRHPAVKCQRPTWPHRALRCGCVAARLCRG